MDSSIEENIFKNTQKLTKEQIFRRYIRINGIIILV